MIYRAGAGRVLLATVFEEEQRWPFSGLDETAQLLSVRVRPKTSDVFRQTAYAVLTIRAPSQYIDDPDWEVSPVNPTAFPLLRELVAMTFPISQQEYVQQHRPHRRRKFAVVRLMQTTQTKDPTVTWKKDQDLPGARILMLESTGEADTA